MLPMMMGAMAPLGAKEATDALIKRQMMQGGPGAQPGAAPPMPPMPMPPQILQQGPQGFAAAQPAMSEKPGMLSGFFDRLDQNMQSPSKQLGLGLLSQINPYLGGLGLLAGGIFGGRNAP